MARPLVLVVDDDFLVRLHTAETFEEAGFDVIEARDAANALDVLQNIAGVQLVCTDVCMPGEIDGIDLATRLIHEYPQIKIIITSAFNKRRDVPSGVRFLPKPFLPARLVAFAREELASFS